MQLRQKFGLLAIFSVLTLSAAPLMVAAQGYPNKQLSMIVPYPAGGPSDVVARQVQPELSRILAQPIIADNVGGVGGALGVQKMLNSPADGYTFLVGTPMELVQAPLALAAVKYKPEEARLVSLIMNTNMVLIARKDAPFNTVDELIQYAKNKSNKELTYGSVGQGSMYHLVAEKFRQQVGIHMLHVPYKGAAPVMQDLLGGQIDLVFFPFAGNLPGMIEGGNVKALGLAAPNRHPRFPNLPLLSENKLLKNFSFDLWIGIEVPQNTPADIVAKLNKAANDVIANPEVKKTIESTGGRAASPMGVEDLNKFYQSEIVRYKTIAKSINLEAQ